MRTLIRPTGFVDSPFGHDGKVARLAGGLNWFAAAELLKVDENRRVGSELVSVQEFERRLDDELSRQWARITGERPALRLGERTVRLVAAALVALGGLTLVAWNGPVRTWTRLPALDAPALAAALSAGMLAVGTASWALEGAARRHAHRDRSR